MQDDLTPSASNVASSGGRIFVVGYMHSGTTLLLNVIRRNPAVFTTGRETKFFDRLAMIRQAYPDLSDDRVLEDFTRFVLHIVGSGYRLGRDPTPPGSAPIRLSDAQFEELLSDVSESRQYAETFSIVQDQLARMAGKSHWLEKTPAHVFHIDHIARVIPDSRFVVAVRDPRDILASKKVRRAAIWTDKYRREERAYKSLIKSYDPVWDALSWRAAARAGVAAEQAHPDRVMTIRYEDLVSQPTAVVGSLCDFLGLDFKP
ncbi:MAG: sulfotransferase family protein, partial [Actinomycetota bacterium]